MTRTLALVFFALVAATAGHGQSQVHGTVTSEMLVEPAETEGVSVELRAERLAALIIEQELNFLEGIQLEVRV
ncbi:MAG: hypothetical protein GVY14_08855, partial [Spirochaetes bacterium]|nr:hypothetical protein [Spirochaetota bacterium]